MKCHTSDERNECVGKCMANVEDAIVDVRLSGNGEVFFILTDNDKISQRVSHLIILKQRYGDIWYEPNLK